MPTPVGQPMPSMPQMPPPTGSRGRPAPLPEPVDTNGRKRYKTKSEPRTGPAEETGARPLPSVKDLLIKKASPAKARPAAMASPAKWADTMDSDHGRAEEFILSPRAAPEPAHKRSTSLGSEAEHGHRG